MGAELIFNHQSNKAKNKHGRGFTLLELLCVVAIIGIIIGISTPVLTKTSAGFYLRNKAKQVEALCQYLRRKSIMENRSYKLVIDFYNNSYLVFQGIGEHPENYLPVNDLLAKSRKLPSALSFKSEFGSKDREEIVFSPSGKISSSEFLIVNERKNTAKLTTTLSGEITLVFI